MFWQKSSMIFSAESNKKYMKIKFFKVIPVLAIILTFLISYSNSSQKAIAQTPKKVEKGILFTFYSPLSAPNASKVYLAGDFNNWGENVNGKVSNPDYEMEKGDNGVWKKIVTIDTEVFHYKFVVADQKGECTWIADPTVFERDGDGNSVYSLSAAKSPSENVGLVATQFKALFQPKIRAGYISILDKQGQVSQSIQIPAVLLDKTNQITNLEIKPLIKTKP